MDLWRTIRWRRPSADLRRVAYAARTWFWTCVVLVGCAQPGAEPDGFWSAWLDSPGGELAFGLELRSTDGTLQAWLINGEERIAVPRASRTQGTLDLDITHYDSRIVAALDESGTRFDGAWRRRSAGSDSWSQLEFHAVARAGDAMPVADADALKRVVGRWRVDFSSEEAPAVGVFEGAADGSLRGTFLTETGDYRFLAGAVEGDSLKLSCFDGAHAFLFHAELQADGSLRGDFWSRDTWHETWTAVRDDEVHLTDAFELTSLQSSAALTTLQFPDLDGVMRSLADPAFQGKARLIEVFGTWCPNCRDATHYMVELHQRYAGRGLKVLGLAFEHTGNFDRDAQQVRSYAAQHGIEYPVLVAGLSDKSEASKAFPALDRVRAFPTMLFVDAKGNVRAIYTGFYGPATGDEHTRMRAQFEKLIEELLAEST